LRYQLQGQLSYLDVVGSWIKSSFAISNEPAPFK
jgi:hypothetical protein